MFEVDSKYPILFCPVRIETKYAGYNKTDNKGTLKIRWFPDAIFIDTFDPRLTKQEIIDATNYWKGIEDAYSSIGRDESKFQEKRDFLWHKLVKKYNCERAAYISKSVIDYKPKPEDATSADPLPPIKYLDAEDIPRREDNEHNAPFCRLLPTRFVVYAKLSYLDKPIKNTELGHSIHLMSRFKNIFMM